MTSYNNEKLSLDKLIISKPSIKCIDNEKIYKNLPSTYWVYDDLLKGLYQKGWFRFAVGFKGALYGNPQSKWCIKLLGMGVGDNPQFFCEKGCYLEHERNMLLDFQEAGFTFQPKVMGKKESIDFLITNRIVNSEQAHLRIENNDLLIMELISGVPFATQTGHYLDYVAEYRIVGAKTKDKMIIALDDLKQDLRTANSLGLLHNDPMPPNIIFTKERNKFRARLVDFEIGQNINKPSPGYVESAIPLQYIDRNVPLNRHGIYTSNLDMHLIDESIQFLEKLPINQKDGLNIKTSLSVNILGFKFSIDFEDLIDIIKKGRS